MRLAARSAIVASASAMVLSTAPAAFAASWKPHWTWSSPTGQTTTINLDKVTVDLAAHLWLQGSDPAVRSLQAKVTPPQGASQTIGLHLNKGGSTRKGTWSGQLGLSQQAPTGLWKVSFTATSTKGQVSHHDNAASFTVARAPQQPFSITPGSVVIQPSGSGVTVRAFWGDRHVEAAEVTVTPPGTTGTVVHLVLSGGDNDYGVWQGWAPLARQSRPGVWTVTTSYTPGSSSSWVADPARTGTFTTQQVPRVSINISATKVTQNQWFTIYGKLLGWRPDGNYSGISGQPVALWWRHIAIDGRWNYSGVTLKTKSDGSYSFKVQLQGSSYLQTRFAGGPLYVAASSAGPVVSVH